MSSPGAGASGAGSAGGTSWPPGCPPAGARRQPGGQPGGQPAKKAKVTGSVLGWFAAKGSPVIKFIDFGGACTWTAEEGLTGLVGTPQYVAPEVVTGYGEDKPTDAPYGKGCGLSLIHI